MIPLIMGLAGLGTAAGSAIGGIIGSSNAANAQERSAQLAAQVQREALAQQQRGYDQQRQDQMPWLQAGQTSLADLMNQMNSGAFNTRLDPSQIANDPGYQFRMAEGQKALERSAAARGGLNGGGFMKSLTRYGQGVASDEYQNAWNRNQADNTGRFNRLASMAGVGQTASQSLGALGAQNNANIGNYANNMGNIYGEIGKAQSAGAMGPANAVSGGFESLGKMATMGGMMAMQGGYGGYGGFGGYGGGMSIPTQGASTGYASGFNPSGGFGLNYGGR